MRALLAWSGALVTVALAIAALTRTTYRAERCVTGSGGSGCEYLSLPLSEMAARFPLQLVGPVVVLAALSLAAVASASLVRAAPRDRVIGGALAGVHALLALPAALALPAPFATAVPLLAAAYAASLLDALLAAAIAVLAWLAGGFALDRFYAVVPVVYGFLSGAASYWAFATAVGIAAGAIAAALGRRYALSRALAGSFLALGAAAGLAHLGLVPFFYPRGAYENPGGPGVIVVAFWLALPSAVLAPIALRIALGAPWRVALAGTLLGFAGLALSIGFMLFALPMLVPA